MILALLLAVSPDAPLAQAEEARTAIIETTRGQLEARGAGCYLPQGRCLAVARELVSLRTRAETADDFVPTWALVVAGVALAVGFASGVFVGVRACAWLRC